MIRSCGLFQASFEIGWPSLVEPGDVGDAGRRLFLAVHEIAASAVPDKHGAVPTNRADEFGQLLAFARLRQLPIKPRHFIVLAIGIVVAMLGAAEFIAGEQHRRAVGEQHGGQHCANEMGADVEDAGIGGRPFVAPVRGIILALTVAIIFAVRLVVPLGIADDIGEREAVVGGGVIQ